MSVICDCCADIFLSDVYSQSGRIGIDEEIDDLKGKSTEEIEELIADKEAKARTQILEMVCYQMKIHYIDQVNNVKHIIRSYPN